MITDPFFYPIDFVPSWWTDRFKVIRKAGHFLFVDRTGWSCDVHGMKRGQAINLPAGMSSVVFVWKSHFGTVVWWFAPSHLPRLTRRTLRPF